MYEIKSTNAKSAKQFKKEISKLTKEKKRELFKSLKNSPYDNKKRGQYYAYDLPEAHRIVYSIIEPQKLINIHVAGNHKVYDRFLDRNKRR